RVRRSPATGLHRHDPELVHQLLISRSRRQIPGGVQDPRSRIRQRGAALGDRAQHDEVPDLIVGARVEVISLALDPRTFPSIDKTLTFAILTEDDERQSLIDTGKGAWVEGETDHLNPSADDEIWYFIVLRSITERSAPLTYPGARILYATGDLAPAPADKKLVHQLGIMTMEAGGRTSAHSHGGTESFYVMKGTVQLATNDGKRQQLTAGQGGSVNPGVIMQLHVVGDE